MRVKTQSNWCGWAGLNRDAHYRRWNLNPEIALEA